MAALGAVTFRKRRMDGFAEAARASGVTSGDAARVGTRRWRTRDDSISCCRSPRRQPPGSPSLPDWGWYIVVYFFLGGIAGGAAFLSGLLDLLGNRLDRRMTRIGYLIALVAIVIGARC